MSEPNPLKEILARSRRIETRLASMMIAMGYETPGEKPTFEAPRADLLGVVPAAVIQMPTRNCTMKAILDCVPLDFVGDVLVRIGDDHVTTLVVGDRT